MNTATATTTPYAIARDTYTGHYYAKGTNRRADAFTARELAEMFGAGREFIVWEFSGHSRTGRPLYVRTRFVGDAEGNLAGYDSEGRKVIVHPAARIIRVLTK